jgi:hypothetical protein
VTGEEIWGRTWGEMSRDGDDRKKEKKNKQRIVSGMKKE